MNLREVLPLYYDFYIVAKEKNISQAANLYHIAQPTLSKNIKNLELLLHCTLINRTNRGIELTMDGDVLYKKLDQIFVNFYSDSEKIFDKELMGTLMIGTTRNIADNQLNIYLSAFSKKCPNVKIKVFTDSASNLNSFLMNHKIDVLIDYLPNINYSEKFELEVKPIGHFNTCFACSKNFWNKNGKFIKKIADLKKYELVIPGSSRRRQILDDFLLENDIKLEPKIEMPDSKLMMDFVLENDSIGYFIEEELSSDYLVKLPLKEKLPSNAFGMIYYKHTLNPVVERFIKQVLLLSKK